MDLGICIFNNRPGAFSRFIKRQVGLFGKISNSRDSPGKVDDPGTLCARKQGNTQRMIETCPKDTETYFHGLPLAKSGDNLNMKINNSSQSRICLRIDLASSRGTQL